MKYNNYRMQLKDGFGCKVSYLKKESKRVLVLKENKGGGNEGHFYITRRRERDGERERERERERGRESERDETRQWRNSFEIAGAPQTVAIFIPIHYDPLWEYQSKRTGSFAQ